MLVLNSPATPRVAKTKPRRPDPHRGPLPIPASFGPFLLAPVVLFIHGYHPFAGDAGIYVAGVRHILDPSLYALNAAFPAAFTRFSIFPWILAALVRLTHLRLSWILLGAHLGSIVLLLAACRWLATRLFVNPAAVWCSMLLAAACFTLPVAGTALFVMDPYVTARSFSTPVSLIAVAVCLDRAPIRTLLLLALAALLHPLMAAYAAVFVILLALIAARRVRLALLFCAVLLAMAGVSFLLAHPLPVSPAYRQAVSLPARTFLFLARWHGYEDLGLVAPLLLFGLALRTLPAASSPAASFMPRALCFTCLLVGITSTLAAVLFVPPGGPYALVPLQILRSFHLIYVVAIVLCGGVLAALLSRSRVAGVTLLVLPFAALFWAAQVSWPGSARIEWPGLAPANPWQQAFLWIRGNTPPNAVFAFNPELVYLPEEDEQGFRAIAERDHLADDKDAGIVAIQPHLADRWFRQRNATLELDRTTDAQRVATLTPLGATWILLPPRAATDLPCPYRNSVVKVCRIAE